MRGGLLAGFLISGGLHGGLMLWAPSRPAIQGAIPAIVRARLETALPLSSAHATELAPAALPAATPRLSRRPAVVHAGVGADAGNGGRVAYVRAYWPSDLLDSEPVPVSAPDAGELADGEFPPSTVRLRLFIGVDGSVEDVRMEGGDAGWEPVRRMFFATRFLPGRRAGHDVASWVEVELCVGDLVRQLD